MKKSAKNSNKSMVIYRSKAGAIELRSDIGNQTIWASQAQIADIFKVERSVVTKHIGNILASKEVDSKSNVQKLHIANSDKPSAFYSLDIMLAVGYRTNSGRAIQFRKWATKVLRSHIVDGYTINKSHIAQNYDAFLKAVADVKALLPAGSIIDNASILELVTLFSDTWLSLDAYDHDKLPTHGPTKKRVAVTAEKLATSLAQLKTKLVAQGQASDLFGAERKRGSVAGIVGNVMQTFDGKPLYASVEEKAAHLLYFMVKDHPFVDGNKRSGAFAFIWFLQSARVLDAKRLTPPALTALTILVAESNPQHKDRIVRLILSLVAKGAK